MTSTCVLAQESLPSFNAIRTPNSPAFSILGVQPTSVERPNTPADLSVSLDNATEGFKKFPQNYSLEFAPYWMSQKPLALTWRQDTIRSLTESLLRTFSVSVATTNKEIGNNDKRRLSYGLRMFLLSGKTSRNSIARLKKLEEELTLASKNFVALAEEQELALQKLLFIKLKEDSTGADKAKILAWFNAERSRINSEKTKHINEEAAKAEQKQEDYAPQREGFILELAFAGAYTSDTIESSLQKSGYAAWLTPAYVKDDYSLVGVYRFGKDSSSVESSEYGARFIYSKERYALSVEYLKGHNYSETSLPARERFSVLFEYMLTKKVWLNLSFGDDNKNIQGKSAVFSSLGVKCNISKKRYAFD